MTTVEEIVTRDNSSGRFHKRYRIGDRLLVDERCNLDQAGDFEVMPQMSRAIDGRGVPVGTDATMLCKWCFPEAKEEDEDSDDSV